MITLTKLQAIAGNCLVRQLSPRKFAIYDHENVNAGEVSLKVAAAETISAGREGHEYTRALGMIRHVIALRIGGIRLRICGKGYPPNGQFSGIEQLEREIKI